VSAANLLSAQSLQNTDFRDPGSVIARLNDIFQMERQNGKYFTIFYGVYDRKQRALAYCNAAHPPALLFSSPTPEGLCQLDSTDPLVGMLPPGMPFETRTVPIEGGRLLVYSDGAYEIEDPSGAMWTLEEFVQFVTPLADQDDLMDRLSAHVRRMHGADTLNDDFSVLEIRWD